MKMRFVVASNRGHDVHFLSSLQNLGFDAVDIERIPQSGPFIYLFPVLDYWRLNKDRCHDQGVDHYSDLINSHIITEINKRGMLIFDLTNEGHAFDLSHFQELDRWIADTNIDPTLVIFAQQNRLLGAQAITSGLSNVSKIAFHYLDFYLIRMLSESLRYANEFPEVKPFSPMKKKFLCYNYTPKLHRVALILWALENKVVDHMLLSFAGLSVSDKGSLEEDFLAQIRSPLLRQICARQLPHLRAQGSYSIDDVTGGGNSLAFNIDKSHYSQAHMSIVTESDFGSDTIRRFTEKPIKPMCGGHPFIVFGNPSSLSLMREMGFQSFSPFIREDYDEITDWEERFNAACAEILRLTSMDNDTFEVISAEMRQICQYNLDRLRGPAIEWYKSNHARPIFQWLEAKALRLA